MGVTSGAVSQQIRHLEDRVGLELFTRTRYGVRLTEAGAKVHPGLLMAFDQIGNALETLEAVNSQPTLIVSTVPSFAASWLVPRLGRFTSRRPDIEVRVEATSNVVDLRRDRVDVAIRHGLGNYPGLVSEHLMAPPLLPVASPALLAAGPSIKTPADCLAYPLLQDSDRADWRLWLQAAHVADDPRAERGPAFEDDFLLVRAAIAGQGIALVRDVYVVDEIESGRLAVVLDRPWPTEFAYYALAFPDTAKRKAVQDFIDWLKDEVRLDAA